MTRIGATSRVAYQGETGAFSESAIFELCGASATAMPCRDFGDVAHAVNIGEADFGILPVENSIAGPVQGSVDAIAGSGLHVVLASEMPISLCLLALPGTTISTLRSVESHPVALRQCARFLTDHPHLRIHEAYDTAGAARLVRASGDPSRAAVASARAGRVNGLIVLEEGIEDRVGNVTRFVLIAREPARALSSALDRNARTIKLD